MQKTVAHLQRKPTDRSEDGEVETDDESEVVSIAGTDEVGDETSGSEAARGGARKTTIAQDVISKRGSYGRFAQSWFSRAGWMQGQKRSMGLSDEAALSQEEVSGEGDSTEGKPKRPSGTPPIPKTSVDADEDSAAVSLLPKLLRTTQILFGTSRSFYFSYDYDITRSLANQHKGARSDGPLHDQVDPLYFWNRHVLQPFIDSGMDAFALPVMQGFVGQKSFVVDSRPPQVDDDAKDSVELSDFAGNKAATPAAATPAVSPPPEPEPAEETRASERKFDITLISRRSIKRAGLRYLRRGVDEEGSVANAVETEQILSPADMHSSSPIYSFVQVRGSIPLFFTQTPYSLKPAPVIQHSLEANYVALKKHFDAMRRGYGSLQIVNLVEKHGSEAKIGVQYERSVQRLNEEAAQEDVVPFEWFDFHEACRGMKFENVALLVSTLGKKIESFGCTLERDGKLEQEQKGVLRTNCMDCLDRTGVCQSSFAKFMLDAQLKEQGFDMMLQKDQVNTWFNIVWADNGDAISKQYASTGAMKGDYTRTRKRDYRGALADVGLSLTRFFNGYVPSLPRWRPDQLTAFSMVNDFFLQTTIDFLLGNVTYRIFDEFEASMMTKDPAVSMLRMREQAIELCQKRVIENESEELVGAWTMLSPPLSDTLTTQPFEEVVLLLTDAAVYLCRFDWNLDKVSSFERVELAHVEHLKFGTYITSTISSTQTDEIKNVGLVITYRPGSRDVLRVNTRSLSSLASRVRTAGPGGPAAGLASLLSRASGGGGKPSAEPEQKRIALKALYAHTSIAETGGESAAPQAKLTEIQLVVSICAEIERLALLSKPRFAGSERESLIEGGDIVSLAEARKSTGLLEHLGHSIKKMVWA